MKLKLHAFKNIRTIIKSKNDWNAYKEYTPENVMKKFMSVFIPELAPMEAHPFFGPNEGLKKGTTPSDSHSLRQY